MIPRYIKQGSDMVKYYALQVKTRGEGKFIRLFKALHPEVPFSLYFPQRSLDIKRQGLVRSSTLAVFPGYVFVEVDDEQDDILSHQWAFRRTDGFYRFLKSNQNIRPLENRDLELVLHFIKKAGPVAGASRVYFNENSRIVVVEGPLMGLEGRIIKVDKRKRRAKIKLDLYDDSFAIDLAFEVMGTLSHRREIAD
jgi:transcriptional antiterminator NusG